MLTKRSLPFVLKSGRLFFSNQQQQRRAIEYLGAPNYNVVNSEYFGLKSELDRDIEILLSVAPDISHGQGIRFKQVLTLETEPELTKKTDSDCSYNHYKLNYVEKQNIVGIIGYTPEKNATNDLIHIVGIEESTGLLCNIQYPLSKLMTAFESNKTDPNISFECHTHHDLQSFIASHSRNWKIETSTNGYAPLYVLDNYIHPSNPSTARSDIKHMLIVVSGISGKFGMMVGTLKNYQIDGFGREVLPFHDDAIFVHKPAPRTVPSCHSLTPRTSCLISQFRADAKICSMECMEYAQTYYALAGLVDPSRVLDEAVRFIRLTSLFNPLQPSQLYGINESLEQWETYCEYMTPLWKQMEDNWKSLEPM